MKQNIKQPPKQEVMLFRLKQSASAVQSSIFTGSESEVPGGRDWAGIHIEASSPLVTFSHWLRLSLEMQKKSQEVKHCS